MNILKLYPKLTSKEKEWLVDWLGFYNPRHGSWSQKVGITTVTLMFVDKENLIAFLSKVVFGETKNIKLRERVWKKLTETYEEYEGKELPNENKQEQSDERIWTDAR